MNGMFVNFNSAALQARHQLARTTADYAEVLTRLSTGLKINSAKDDPAGLIASELLRSDIVATNKAIINTERANSVLVVADSALGQISALLNDIRGLVVESANTGVMNESQIEANQLQVDASIDAIDRIAHTTNYQGKKLLDGSLEFSARGVDGGLIDNLVVHSANFGTADALDVEIKVTETAKKGTLLYYGNGVSQTTTLDVIGSAGSKTLTFGAGTSIREIATAIAASSDATGVTAYVEGEAVRGSVILSSTGANNDIVVTAKNAGFDEGNYSFRIVAGASNDARVVSEAKGGRPGVVEITLLSSYEQRFSNVAGMFDLVIDTGYAGNDAATAPTSVYVTQGRTNTAVFHEQAATATGLTTSGTTVSFENVTAGHMSAVNGWTMAVDGGSTESVVDRESKTIRLTLADAQDGTALSNLLETATGALGEVRIATGTLENGDRFTFSGGGDAGELVVTYKEGATAGEIRDLINRTGRVQASLASGISANDLIPYVPDAPTYLVGNSNNIKTDYRSGTTASEVVDLINNRLGHLFEATMLSGDSGTGTVSYMNASVVYGNVETENAVRFTGLDSGPIVRLVTGGADRDLSVRLLTPSSEDIAKGVSTPILEIQLATDAAGNSLTTAKELADFFDRLSPALTLGVNAELVYPAGMDPNGRVWITDECGNTVVEGGCPQDFGRGIVRPTGIVGDCTIQQNDLVLLGNNQKTLEVGKPVARIAASIPGSTVPAHAGNTPETVNICFGNTSALNGTSITFTSDASKAGFNSQTGRLNIYLDAATRAQTGEDFTEAVKMAIDGQVRQNWAMIRQYTQAPGDPPGVTNIFYDSDYTDLLAIVDSSDASAVLTFAESQIPPAYATTDKGPITLPIQNGGLFTTEVTFTLTSQTQSDALNGMTVNLGTADYWDAATKTLTVAVTAIPENETVTAGLLEGMINDALRDVALLTGPDDKVSLTAVAKGDYPVTEFTADELQSLKFGKLDHGSSGGTGDSHGGVGPADAAVIVTSIKEGPAMSGTNVYLVEDERLAVGTIEVHYDEAQKMLTVLGNTGGTRTMSAAELAGLLNADANFRYHCEMIDLTADVTPGAIVPFTDAVGQSAGIFVGGYEIVTGETDGVSGGVSGGAATSAGMAMTGQNAGGERLVLQATETGSRNFVRVDVAEGNFTTYCPLGLEMCSLAGTDVVATVNGIKARAEGNRIKVNTADLALEMDVVGEVVQTRFTLTGGGSLFQLGANVRSTQQIRIALGNMSATHLGGSHGKLFQLRSGNDAALTVDTTLADRIVGDAISAVTTTRGRIGAIQRSTLDPNILALQDSLVALTEGEAQYTNADFAEEASRMSRAQILLQAGSQVLATANQQSQYAAMLIG